MFLSGSIFFFPICCIIEEKFGLFDLWFYVPVNKAFVTMVMSRRSVNLTTLFLGRRHKRLTSMK